MNVLFVCSRNQWRSPTAEYLFRNVPNFHARSAGTASSAKVRISEKLINWADLIFTMEKKHKEQLLKKYPRTARTKIITLDINDDYQFMDSDLIDSLKQAITLHLPRIDW